MSVCNSQFCTLRCCGCCQMQTCCCKSDSLLIWLSYEPDGGRKTFWPQAFAEIFYLQHCVQIVRGNLSISCPVGTRNFCMEIKRWEHRALKRWDSSDGIATRYRLDGPARFSSAIQTDSETHPAFYTMGTGSLAGVKRTGRCRICCLPGCYPKP